jgi:hypothetical protein
LSGDTSEGAAALYTTQTDGTLNVCTTENVPKGLSGLASSVWLGDAIANEPIPPASIPLVPRSRAELGFFIGASITLAESTDLALPFAHSLYPRAAAAVRAGYGFSAITAPRMSNQIFGEVGLVGQEYTEQQFGAAFRVQVPWAYVPLDGALALPVAAARQDSPFWVGWAERAGRGPFGIQRTFLWSENFSGAVSALTDFSFFWFPSENLYELAAPIVSFYGALPLNGLLATDAILDLGVQELFGSFLDRPHTGLFVSFSAAMRVFPGLAPPPE